MKIVVTGATGFIGRPLVGALLARGHHVTALSRDPGRAAAELAVKCDCRAWDPARGVLDADIVRASDAVIHLAGEGVADKPWSEARKQALRASRLAGSELLARAIGALPAGERPGALISASAIGFYGDRGDTQLDETAPAGRGFLAELCEAWESRSLAVEPLGVRAAVVRIGIVLGRDGGALARMLPPFRLGLGGRLGSGRQWMSWVHLDDIVNLFALAVEREAVRGIVNGVAPNPVTNAEFSRRLGKALHRPALLPVPAAPLRLALGEMSSILLTGQRVVPAAALRLGFEFRHPDLDEALADSCGDGAHTLESEQWVGRSPEQVFPFFSEARNLEQITPPFLGFRMLQTSTPEIEEGTLIDYRLSLHGLPLRWRSRIEEWQPGRRFVDVQIKGPYKLWHHTHEFEAYNGGTIVRDRVRYALPGGAVGDLVGGPFVRRDLRAIFDYRRKVIAQRFS